MVKKIIFIAEAGQGHEGSIKNVKKYIYAAKKSKFKFLKFHLVYADELASKNYKYYNFFKKIEISLDKWKTISNLAKKERVELAFDVLGKYSLMVAEKCNVKMIKIHSTDIYNYELHKLINISKIKNVLLSTSGCNEKEIKIAIKNLKNKKVYLIHGFQNYPTKSNKLNLSKINTLSKKFNLEIGYSDHSSSGLEETIYNCAIAVSFNVKIIEKHFSYDSNIKIEDDESALNLEKFNKLIKLINICKNYLGTRTLILSNDEIKYRRIVSRSFFAKNEIKKNRKLRLHDLKMIRDKYASRLSIDEILNSIAKKNIKKNTLIRSNLFSKK